MGSPANWIRNRAEICCGDHHSASQLLTRSASGRWASFGILGRLACCWARWWARHARYWARPPLAATSRDTVEVAFPSRAAIAVKDSPACTPRVTSSRSARVSRPGPGTQRSCRTSRRGLRRAISATPWWEQPTWGPISRSDRPLAFSVSASYRCSAVRWTAIHEPSSSSQGIFLTRRGSCADHFNAPCPASPET